MTRRLLATAFVAALLSAGCFEFMSTSKATGPSGVQTLNGSWTSVSTNTTLHDTCTNFQWTMTDSSATEATGTFTATCFENMQVSGTIHAQLVDSTINWTATAVGVSPEFPSCPISLSGTAQFEGEYIRITYTGTTCMGTLSGSELLRRN